jgi:hypothetical protein
MPKPKRWLLILLLTIGGAGYFSVFSLLDTNSLLKNQLALLPIQVGVLLYLLWWKPRAEQK